MRIQYCNQFFAGPSAPGPAQPRKFVRRLADRGHAVDVIGCDFNAYNEQDEPPESYETLSGGSVRVHRLATPRGLRASLGSRLRTYLRFAWSAYRFGRDLPVPDVVMTSMQPLFAAYAVMRLARRWKRPFLLEVRDLWPDALVAKRAISSWQAAPLDAIARALYAGADRIVSLTPGIKTELLKKGIAGGRVDVFPNGFDAETLNLEPGTRERMRERLGWGDKFVAAYTGAHTEVTAIEVIVRAAHALRNRRDIRIDLFGSGQTKAGAMSLAEELGLGNVRFHDPAPKSEVPSILAGADAGLMTLFHSPLIHIYFENKLIDYMGAGKPILAAMEGVQAEIIRRCNAGNVVATLDHEGLARLIAEAADQPALCREMGAAGYRFVSTRLVQREILDRYADVLEALARGEIDRVPVWDPFEGAVK